MYPESNLSLRPKEPGPSIDPLKIAGVELPQSILNLICIHLGYDIQSLFSLGRTCRAFNTVAFACFLQKHNHYDLKGYLDAPTDAPYGLLTALRCALFVNTLDRFAYSIQPWGLKSMVEQLLDLLVIVNRQPKNEWASFHFLRVGHAVHRTEPRNASSFTKGYSFSLAQFQTLMQMVLTAVVNKGCKRLEFSRGEEFFTERSKVFTAPDEALGGNLASFGAHVNPKGSIKGDKKTRDSVKRFFSGLSSHLKPRPVAVSVDEIREKSPKATAPFFTTEPGISEHKEKPTTVTTVEPSASNISLKSSLEDVSIYSDLLLSPIFLDFTIFLLQSSSSTLTNLTFECEGTSSSLWHTLLSSLHLTSLTKLKIIVEVLLVREMLDINPDDIAHFLSQNENIEEVFFYGVKPGTPSPKVLDGLVMHGLTSFTGHPSYVSWILKLLPHQVPRLERVAVATEYYTKPGHWFDQQLLDDVLEIMATYPRPLTLGLSFKIRDVSIWMEDHIKKGTKGNNLIRSLTKIQNLEITLSWYLSFTEEQFKMFAEFVDAFPSVRHVVFQELAIYREMKDPKRVEDWFRKWCPRLETVRFNDGATIHLKGGPKMSHASEPGPPLPGPSLREREQ